jgi:hypothetical protein
MAIQIIDNFSLNANKPIDNRFVVGVGNFYTLRNDIPTNRRYQGLRIWDLNDNLPYVWDGTQWISENTLGISGSGTINYVSKFDSSNTITNSQIFDNGSNVGIGTTTFVSPSTKLQVNGIIRTTTGGFYGNGANITLLNINQTNVTGKIGFDNLPNGTNGQILQSTGTSTQWVNQNTLSVGSATNANNVNIVSDATSNNNRYIPFVYGTGNQQIRINTTNSIRVNPFNGNIGIGGDAQSYRLYVNGGASIGTTTAPPSSGLRVNGAVELSNNLRIGGNVGIGGNAQSHRLYVNGGASIGTTTAPPTNGLIVNGNVIIGNLNLTYNRLSITNGVDSRDGFYINLGFGGSPANWRSPETTKGGLAFFYQTSTIVPPDSQNKFIMYTNVPPTSTGGLVTLKDVFKFSPVDPRVQFDYGLSIPNEPETAGLDRKIALKGNNGEIRWSGVNANSGSVSDLNLKKNIIPISSSIFKDILNLNPVNFEWIDNDGMLNKGINIGLIAQDVQKYYPDAINKDVETGNLSINVLSMISLLIGQIKNQNEEILKLSKRIEDLES